MLDQLESIRERLMNSRKGSSSLPTCAQDWIFLGWKKSGNLDWLRRNRALQLDPVSKIQFPKFCRLYVCDQVSTNLNLVEWRPRNESNSILSNIGPEFVYGKRLSRGKRCRTDECSTPNSKNQGRMRVYSYKTLLESLNATCTWVCI